eukprot:TRINITY_DN56452_c0_g1_i1.p1 TRINITY_DN56452_c0_g1~~TRINITY_DN56452_c0_g1_i1.p1  ORF type:complete len:823 (+),score=83.54 TRINITY_DN56452_c0_g1_i1:302-2470(+)
MVPGEWTLDPCVPGALVLSILCLISAIEIRQSAASLKQRESRVRWYSTLSRGCLNTTIWASKVRRLLETAGLHLSAQQYAPHLIGGPTSMGRWHDETFARCSEAPPHCWPHSAFLLMSSCLYCCSPEAGPRGRTECFDLTDKKYTFEVCCGSHLTNLDETVGAWVELTPASLNDFVSASSGLRASTTGSVVPAWYGPTTRVNWDEVEHEVKRGCGGEESELTFHSRLQSLSSDVRTWLDMGGDGQRLWPEFDAYIARSVCTMNDTWVAAPAADEETADGAELLFRANLLCGFGCCAPFNDSFCPLERRSRVGDFASLPCIGSRHNCDFADGTDDSHVFNVHAIESGQLPAVVQCPTAKSGGVAILLGQPSQENMGHFLSEMLFLAAALRLARFGAFKSRTLFVVPTKWRMWWCPPMEKHKPQECQTSLTSGQRQNHKMADLLYGGALRFIPEGMDLQWVTPWTDEYPFTCPRCFDAVVQQFRAFSGEASLHNEFRRGTLALCGVQEGVRDFPYRPRVVLLRRTRVSRSWGDVEHLLLQLLSWGDANGWQIDIVTLGELSPCNQILALHDASITIAVFSTEHYLASAFVPESAALILLHASRGYNFSRDDLDSIRGPGMERNASSARRFRALCNDSWIHSRRTSTPVVTPTMSASQVANARNLLVLALNNVTCHRPSDHGSMKNGCDKSGHVMYGAVSTHWADVLRALDVARAHLQRWIFLPI